MNEEWRPIGGFEGCYEVSNKGNVRSMDRCGINGRKLKGKPMKVWVGGKRYPLITLSKGTSEHSFFVHRLVAEAFIPNPHNKLSVNHKDGNKKNNNVGNLEWMTFSENQIHAISIGLSKVPILQPGENHPTAKLTNVDIEMIRILLQHDFTLKQISKRFNVHEVHIGAIKSGKTWKHQI